MSNTTPRKITLFDESIKARHGLYELPFDWRLLKAQLIAESKLDPMAVSPVGAEGIAQFMPDTWNEWKLKAKLPLSASPFNADFAIKCCAGYMRQLVNAWSAPRPEIDRYCLALASYNAGMKHLLAAQKLAGGSNAYCKIIAELHQITGTANAQQTARYVATILGEWRMMIIEG